MRWWRGLIAAWLCLQGLAIAAPQINWGEMLAQAQGNKTQESLVVDLRERWETTMVGGVQEPSNVALDPEQIWRWPSERFSSKVSLRASPMRDGERIVTRMTVFSERLATDLNLSAQMPRLDAMHVSYRHDGGAWKTLSAGDRIAMHSWPLADRQPSFNLPLPPGQLDVVIQFVHRGVLHAPVLLQNNRAFLESHTTSIWVAGLFMGINLMMALMGVLMALNFRKLGFLSVAVMSMMMSSVLLFGSGLGGMLLGTGSDTFNDEVKFINNTAWGMMLPVVAAAALSIHVNSRRWWWTSVLFAAAGVILAMVLVDYRLRDSSPTWVAIMLFVVLGYVAAMLAWAWYMNYTRQIGIAVGVLLYVCALFILFTAYVGLMGTDSSGALAATVCIAASLALARGLYLQHRMGKQVIARANTSPLRDVLTGLLNRDGMQAHLYKLRERLLQQQTCAVFFYISVLDTQAAMDEHGEQGFEMGMVQIAASLSTSVTSTDGVGRVSGHAFGITVLMPPDPALAIRMAQKVLSRLMALASHGAPMASTARIALAWLPLNGFRVDTVEKRCIVTLQLLENGKRIGWVGGVDSHRDASQLLRDSTLALSTASDMAPLAAAPVSTQNGSQTNLYDRIHRIEREMLHGIDTQFLVEEADRLSRALNGQQTGPPSTQDLEDGPKTVQEGYSATRQSPMPQAL